MGSGSSSAGSGLAVAAHMASKYSQGTVNAHRKLNRYPSHMTSEKIKKIYFCQQSSEVLIGAFYHAYLIIKSQNYYWRCEIGGSSDDVLLIIETCNYDNNTFEAVSVGKVKTIKDLIDFSKNQWLYTIYDIVHHNCYDYCKNIMKEFTMSNSNINKIEFYEKGNMGLASGAVLAAGYGAIEGVAFMAPSGPIGMAIGGVVGGIAGFIATRVGKKILFD